MISPEGTTDTDGHRTAVHILISSEVTEKSEEMGDSGPPHHLSLILSIPLRSLPFPSPLHFSAISPFS